VFSGGGSRGNFHVGWAQWVLGELGLHYDIYCGVSVGALVAAYLSQFKAGQEEMASAGLSPLFTPIQNDDIWTRHFPFGMAHGAWKSSFLDGEPLIELIQKSLDENRSRNSGKTCIVGCVSLSTGLYQVFDQTHIPFWKAVAASASFPAFLTPIHMGGEWWTDGGVRTVTPIKAAIAAGATEIDVSLTTPPKPTPDFGDDPSAVDIAMRAIDLMSDEIVAKDIREAQRINRILKLETDIKELNPEYPTPMLDSGKRVIDFTISRPDTLLNSDPLQFGSGEAVEMQERGHQKAVHNIRIAA